MSRQASRLLAPAVLILALLGARLAAAPALTDPVLGTPPPSIHLSIPPIYLLLAPMFTVWDGISMLSMSRLRGFLQGLVGLYFLWRLGCWWLNRSLGRLSVNPTTWFTEARVLVLVTVAFFLFVAVGALWHRPMLSLSTVPSGITVVDFHSHTNLSHDVRGTLMQGFDAEANRRWHRRAGFDAAFLTDHNVLPSPPIYPPGHPVLCPGIEVSAWRAHIVLLGDTLPVSTKQYGKGLEGLLALLRSSDSTYGSLSVASLPEYRRNHWERLDQLIAAGLDGLEIVNASPAANELSRTDRDSVIALARAHNRFVVGVSDSHGWGATSMVWNLVAVPPGTTDLCTSVLGQLRLGFPAVRIVERHRLRGDDPWPMWLTPVGVLWETWRGMSWPLTFSWIGWTLLWMWWRVRSRALAKPKLKDQDS
ncbi:MAG TPA: hypothetical protein VFX42_06805 [Gemmatimonadales bacterium]|nr:hypothetical protein [Gemmatimonadales bacterium]